MAESVVIIPTYNEIENIERMLETVLALDPPFHVLIVDDGSPDGTAVAVNPDTRLRRHAQRAGWRIEHWDRP